MYDFIISDTFSLDDKRVTNSKIFNSWTMPNGMGTARYIFL